MNRFSQNVLQFPPRPIAPHIVSPIAPEIRQTETKFHPLVCTALIVAGTILAWALLSAVAGRML